MVYVEVWSEAGVLKLEGSPRTTPASGKGPLLQNNKHCYNFQKLFFHFFFVLLSCDVQQLVHC